MKIKEEPRVLKQTPKALLKKRFKDCSTMCKSGHNISMKVPKKIVVEAHIQAGDLWKWKVMKNYIMLIKKEVEKK